MAYNEEALEQLYYRDGYNTFVRGNPVREKFATSDHLIAVSHRKGHADAEAAGATEILMPPWITLKPDA